MIKRDYVGLSEASSAARDGDEEEEEIELGLSLGAKRVTAGKSKAATAAGGWGRILTAKDFPSAMGSRASPLSSSSSVSSSEGAKRVADNDGAASNNPPSQVLVGWPPIRDFRIKNTLVNKDNNSDSEAIANKNNQNNNADDCITTKNQDKRACGGNVGVTRFVKVNMDGDPIGRKVDLSAHQSYETLALALEMMFHKPTTSLGSSAHCAEASKLLDGSSEFALTYEDKDGDWMLVGDVPWGMFLDTVKRLRIMRTSDANGLAPRYQSSTGGQLLRSNPT